MTPSASKRRAFVVAFKTKFGSRAVEVARLRVMTAEPGEVRDNWRAILDDVMGMVEDVPVDAGITRPEQQ